MNKSLKIKNLNITFKLYHHLSKFNSNYINYKFKHPEIGLLFKKSNTTTAVGKTFNGTRLKPINECELKVALLIVTFYILIIIK